MKLLQTLIFIAFSLVAHGQDVSYKHDIKFVLTHSHSRKWTGVDKTQTLSGMRSLNLVFHANHTVDEQPVNSHKYPVSQHWQLITGTTIRDENITIQVGETVYAVVFSKTANGSDFITLTWSKNDRVMTSSYYAEQ